MPKFLEDRLRAEAARKGFSAKQPARYIYGAMNNIGAMHGSKETPKGARMDAKHERDESQSSMPHPHRNLGRFLHPPKRKKR